MTRKLILMVVSTILPEYPLMAAYTSLFVVQVATVLHLMCEPFLSKRQQSLETFSLFATAIMYHLGIMQKAARNDSASQQIIKSFILFLQLLLNGALLWAFFRFLFKDTMLETIKTKVASDKEHIQSENISREKLIQREVIEFHPGARALLQDALTKTGLEQSNRKSRDVIVDAEVPDLWMKHMQLSVNLEMLRDSWHHVKGNKRRDTDHQQ